MENSPSQAGPAQVPAKALGVNLRVLCVDPERELVDRLLRASGREARWDITHASEAEAAIELAQAESFDVLLAPKNLPGLSGPELAAHLNHYHPRLTSFLWSGPGLDDAPATSSARYQLLPRDCPVPLIISTVQRRVALQSWLTNNTTRALVVDIDHLPSLPSTYLEVLRQIQSPAASGQDIAKLISEDIGMTGKILQVANSAYYGAARKITSPRDAVLYLGLETVKSLVHYTHALNQFPNLSGGAVNFEKLWAHSIAVARGARRIAEMEMADETLAEEAFTAGLMHDIGKLILASVIGPQYQEAVRLAEEKKTIPWLIERIKLGTTHAETGAYMLGLWGIPTSILEAVAWHHCPSQCFEKKFSPLTAVHAANVLEHARKAHTTDVPVPEMDLNYLADLGLRDRVDSWKDALEPHVEHVTPRVKIKDLPKAAPARAKPVPQPPNNMVIAAWVIGGVAAVLTAIYLLSR